MVLVLPVLLLLRHLPPSGGALCLQRRGSLGLRLPSRVGRRVAFWPGFATRTVGASRSARCRTEARGASCCGAVRWRGYRGWGFHASPFWLPISQYSTFQHTSLLSGPPIYITCFSIIVTSSCTRTHREVDLRMDIWLSGRAMWKRRSRSGDCRCSALVVSRRFSPVSRPTYSIVLLAVGDFFLR